MHLLFLLIALTAPIIPQEVAAVLPFIATGLSHWFQSDGLAKWQNGVIALIAILVTSFACVAMTGGFNGTPVEITMVVLAYVTLLMNKDYAVLLTWIQSIPSPIVSPTQRTTNTPIPTTPQK